MLHTLDQMFSSAQIVVPAGRTWVAIPGFLKAEVMAGAPSSSRKKARSAVNGLLKARKLSPENAPINLDWFDRTFPLDGWDTTMPFQPDTWLDYIYRVRPILERMTGADLEKKALRNLKDDWTELGTELGEFERFKKFGGAQSLIPINNTLAMAARRVCLRTSDIDQVRLQGLHDAAHKAEKRSVRSASVLIAELQSTTSEIWKWFPHPITAIEAEGGFQYEVPTQLEAEVEAFVETASRKRYIRVKKKYDYVSDGTRTNFQTTMHAVIDGLVRVGRLRRDGNGFACVLEDADALDDLVNHMVERVEKGEIVARSATSLMRRLPIILDRNGIDSTHLRAAMSEVDELQQDATKSGMPVSAKRLCRKLIENRAFRNRFLLAHARPRQVAQAALDAAKAEGRELTAKERSVAISHGVVAAFCALEVGGAPLRVDNFLSMPYGAVDAWIYRKGKGFEVTVPAEHTKNKEEIKFEMQPTEHKWSDTIAWYLAHIRPLILKDPQTGELRASQWFVPMLSDPTRRCPYETFHDWFVRIMRDVVKVPCLPHNYRHGQASLLYHNYPHRIGWIARRLGDTEATVVLCYAWVHIQKAMVEGQNLVSDLITK